MVGKIIDSFGTGGLSPWWKMIIVIIETPFPTFPHGGRSSQREEFISLWGIMLSRFPTWAAGVKAFPPWGKRERG